MAEERLSARLGPATSQKHCSGALRAPVSGQGAGYLYARRRERPVTAAMITRMTPTAIAMYPRM